MPNPRQSSLSYCVDLRPCPRFVFDSHQFFWGGDSFEQLNSPECIPQTRNQVAIFFLGRIFHFSGLAHCLDSRILAE